MQPFHYHPVSFTPRVSIGMFAQLFETTFCFVAVCISSIIAAGLSPKLFAKSPCPDTCGSQICGFVVPCFISTGNSHLLGTEASSDASVTQGDLTFSRVVPPSGMFGVFSSKAGFFELDSPTISIQIAGGDCENGPYCLAKQLFLLKRYSHTYIRMRKCIRSNICK